MMKNVVLYCFVLILSSAVYAGIPRMSRLDIKLFELEGRTDFESFFLHDNDSVKIAARWLFENNILNQSNSKAYDINAEYDNYWSQSGKDWWLVDLNRDGKNELIFSGRTILGEETETMIVYAQYGEIWKQMFNDEGRMMGFVIQPNTGEVILIHHRYPCCSSYTHSINRLRFLNNKIYEKEKYFVGTDFQMKGKFLPAKISNPKGYKVLVEPTMLRWSNAVISTGAHIQSPNNEVIEFNEGSIYKVLAKEGDWKYVLMCTPPPIADSRMINPNNLTKTKVLGWMLLPN